MQMMPGTSDAMRVLDPFNSFQSIYGGTEYLRRIVNIPASPAMRPWHCWRITPDPIALCFRQRAIITLIR
jgi:hypothetical protein